MADDERPDEAREEPKTPQAAPVPEQSVPEPETPEIEVPEAEAPAATDATAAPEPVEASGPGLGHAVTIISLRVVRGLAGMAAAAAVIAAVGLVQLPTIGITPLATTVEPQPADLLAVCPGAALRLGDETGANAGRAFPVGTPEVTVVSDGTPSRTPLASDTEGGGNAQAPTLVRLPPSDDAVLAAAQAQSLDRGGLRGLAVAGCTEPTSSAWLVGGATTVGRTTVLLLANPTEVEAEVEVSMWGESGAVAAPGMKGITVPAGSQRVLALSGFAPDLVSPVVHVEARGGQVVAALQTSVTRVLDPGGLDLVSAGAAPARELVIPAVRIVDAEGVASSLGLEGYEDLEAVVRIGNPGDATATVEVSVTSTSAGGPATSFQLQVPPGQVSDTSLATALPLGAEPFADGSYTVTLHADLPVVAGVRTSTIPIPATGPDGELQPGGADLAWFASASGLTDESTVAVAGAPDAVLVAASTDGAAHTLTLTPIEGGADISIEVPATGSTATPLDAGTGYLLRGADGVAAGLSFASPGGIAGYPLVAPRAADSPIVIRP